MVCLCLFVTGILLCDIAPNTPMFIIGRVVQGLGGGSACSLPAYVETDLIPMERRVLIERLNNVCTESFLLSVAYTVPPLIKLLDENGAF